MPKLLWYQLSAFPDTIESLGHLQILEAYLGNWNRKYFGSMESYVRAKDQVLVPSFVDNLKEIR